MGNAGHCTCGCGCLRGLRRADLQSSEEGAQQKGVGRHRGCGICGRDSGGHSDRPDTDAALTGYPDVRDVTEEIENELIAKMLEVLEEFRYTQLFPQSGPAAEAQPLSGGGRGLLPPTGARQRLRDLHGKAEKGVHRPYAA